MHIMNRAATVAVLLAGLVPLLTFALITSEERIDAERAFRSALDKASAEYQRTRSLPALKRLHEAELREAQARVPSLMREKRALRLKIAGVQRAIAVLEQRFGWLAQKDASADMRPEDIVEAFAYVRRSQPILGSAVGGRSFFRRALVASFGVLQEEDLQWGMLESVLRATAEAEAQRGRLLVLQVQHDALRIEALRMVAQLERSARGLAVTESQLKDIQANMEEVHAQVLKMQGALARIDAKLRSRVERELLEKGLLTPGAIDRSAMPVTPQFAWPAYGTRSAGFLDAGYQELFGISHYGVDIVVGQGSPVFSAADGIVFLARDGGARGYSYVLVGHRGGYATLYGHLSKITVTSGQDLKQGEAVGLSGGAVGAYGSGPTTTGPHLHCEVIKDGTNIDPLFVLP